MAINRQQLLEWKIPSVEQTYTKRDCVLFALGIGVGIRTDFEATDSDELQYVVEEQARAFPSMGLVLGYPGLWLRDPRLGVDWKRMLHGAQGIEIYKPLPPEGTIIGKTRVVDVVDKGTARGAIVYTERDVIDAESGSLMCRLSSTSVLRGDGGFGGPDKTPYPIIEIPSGAPDHVVEAEISSQAALIYRLSGDTNPLHVNPEIALEAGFNRPILHGLCTFSSVVRALIKTICPCDPYRLASLNARFTSPVYPGETIRTEIWLNDDRAYFRSTVDARSVTVLNNGLVKFCKKLP